jgi:hypothetical protein
VNTAFVGAYITGSEVLWRMSQAQLPWESAKYVLTILFVLAMIRTGKFRGAMLAIIFFILLLPSAVLSSTFDSSTELRKLLSFNLSGPLSLAVSVSYFSHVRFTVAQLHRVFLFLLGPIISMATIVLLRLLQTQEMIFSENSNFSTSGGFGPNQVSSLFGLGILVLYLWSFDKRISWVFWVMLYSLIIWLGVQSALTFSRTGLYAAVISAVFSTWFLVQNGKTRVQLLVGLGAILLITELVALPRLDEYTSGTLTRRFSNTQLTGRERIMNEDLKVFWDNPWFGVGPGQTYKYRSELNRVAAHTEFSRLLAEHGLFGALSLVILLVLAVLNFRRAQLSIGKALCVASICWSFAYMAAAAMRTVAPAFIFGLSACTLMLIEREHSHSTSAQTSSTQNSGEGEEPVPNPA